MDKLPLSTMQGNDTKPSLLKSTLYHWNKRAHVQFHLSVSKVNKRSSLRTITTFDRNSSIKWSCFSGQRATSPNRSRVQERCPRYSNQCKRPHPVRIFIATGIWEVFASPLIEAFSLVRYEAKQLSTAKYKILLTTSNRFFAYILQF